jgi:hypothetical protein
MHSRTDRYLIFLGIAGVVLSAGIGYQYALTATTTIRPHLFCSRPSSLAMKSLRDTQLPSVIPNFRIAARRHLFLPIDLRRADLQLDIQSDSATMTTPVLDKVLFVPKKFG